MISKFSEQQRPSTTTSHDPDIVMTQPQYYYLGI
jgi:hypothetical protein